MLFAIWCFSTNSLVLSVSKADDEGGLDDAAYLTLYNRGYRPKFPKNAQGQRVSKGDLYRRRHLAAYLTAQGMSIAKVSEATSLNAKTISDWVRDPEFRQLASLMEVHAIYDVQSHEAKVQLARLEEARSSVDTLVALTKLRSASIAAVAVLLEVAQDVEVPARWRIEASSRILDRAGLPAQHDVVHSGGVTHTVQDMSIENALKALGADDSYLEPVHDLKQLQDGEYEAEIVTTTDGIK